MTDGLIIQEMKNRPGQNNRVIHDNRKDNKKMKELYEAIERNIKALVEFSNICKEESCEKVYCMGTSALRDSKNKDVFVKLAKDKAGIDVDIISGEKESNLGFMGVLEGIENAEDILVIDIGGGEVK